MLWGWIENTSCQLGDLVHKELLKCFARINNNRQVLLQFLSYWERAEQLLRGQNKKDFEEEVDDQEVS